MTVFRIMIVFERSNLIENLVHTSILPCVQFFRGRCCTISYRLSVPSWDRSDDHRCDIIPSPPIMYPFSRLCINYACDLPQRLSIMCFDKRITTSTAQLNIWPISRFIAPCTAVPDSPHSSSSRIPSASPSSKRFACCSTYFRKTIFSKCSSVFQNSPLLPLSALGGPGQAPAPHFLMMQNYRQPSVLPITHVGPVIQQKSCHDHDGVLCIVQLL